jgi:hypothetical protein
MYDFVYHWDLGKLTDCFRHFTLRLCGFPFVEIKDVSGVLVSRDENGSDTNRYHWYHICFHISVRIRIRIWIVSTMSNRIWLDINIINMWFEQARLRGGCRQCDGWGPMALGPISPWVYASICIWQPIQFSSSSPVCAATLPIRESRLRGIPWQRVAASLRLFAPGSEFPIPMS